MGVLQNYGPEDRGTSETCGTLYFLPKNNNEIKYLAKKTLRRFESCLGLGYRV